MHMEISLYTKQIKILRKCWKLFHCSVWEVEKAFWKNSSLSAVLDWAVQANAVTVHNWVGKHQYILKDVVKAGKWTKAEKGNIV